MSRIEIDGGSYSSACEDFYSANQGLVDDVSTMSSGVNAGAAMAGDDSGGRAFAAQYDEAAAQTMTGGSQLANAMGVMGNLLNASLINHASANGGAVLPGYPGYQAPDADGDPNPNHYSVELYPGTPPSAFGGSGDTPDGWHWISEHLDGLLWPDADTGKLRDVGKAWTTGGSCFAAWKYDVDAAQAKISVLKSPEVPTAVETCTDLSTHCTDFETACLGLGKACDDYATQVDDHRREILGILKELLAWTVVDEVSGAILSFFTAGAAEVAAQLAEAGIIGRYAAKIIAVLRKLVEWAKICVEAIKTALVAIKDALLWLPRLLKAKVMVAVAKVGEAEGRVLWTSWANYPKVVKDGREYAQVGDRLYSHHAVDRLQPSGLGAPAGAVGAGRSISPNFIADILKYTTPKPEIVDGVTRMVYESGTVRVVTENDIVITVITRGVK